MKKALILDDSKVVRKLIYSMIEKRLPDYQIFEMPSGEEAMEMILKKQIKDFSFVIIDYNLLGMNGLEFYLKIKDMVKISHSFILTANIQQKVKEKIEQNNVVLIEKPFKIESFEKIIMAALQE
ncbi:MAG: response regulator [Oligoflexia bacterium]|nr:response regulator [Oligoflexia bacterium]